MKRIVVLAAALFISGCATVPQADPQAEQFITWAQTMADRAEAGEIKHSDYYTEAYNRLAAISDNRTDKLLLQRGYAELIPKARAYERGEITREQFDDARRMARVQQQERQAAADAQYQRDAADAQMRAVQGMRSTNAQQRCVRVGYSLQCYPQ